MGFRRWLGDYAGYAQESFEKDHSGVSAHFLMGCGGDQNPYPRSQLKYAHQHGRSLATAVEAALQTNQAPLDGPIRSVLEAVDLEYTVPDRPPLRYPVQIVQFGKDLAIIALGSEVVVDYSLRLKRELARPGGAPVLGGGALDGMGGHISP